jgi:hypothetical protein
MACRSSRVSHEDCARVTDHAVDLLIAEAVQQPEATWDQLASAVRPAQVTRAGFGAWLRTPDGKAWLDQRRARTRSGREMDALVEQCVQKATPAVVSCWLAAPSSDVFARCE